MRLTIEHTTRVVYESAVTDAVMLVRLGPLSDASQSWEEFALTARPNASVQRFVGGFGNIMHLITVPAPHTSLEITTSSTVSTLPPDPQLALPPRVEPLTISEQFDYLRPSRLVP